jgi:hypothetical protein
VRAPSLRADDGFDRGGEDEEETTDADGGGVGRLATGFSVIEEEGPSSLTTSVVADVVDAILSYSL